jgi:predicted  nucleic acid-binding Zn-ribbon protein
MSEMPQRTINCGISEIKIANLEKGLDKVMNEVGYIKSNSDNQGELMAKIETMMEFVIEDRKEQREINKETSETLKSINANLTGLNKDVGSLHNDVSNMKGKISLIEEYQDVADKKGTINLVDLLTDNMKTVIGLLAVAGVLYIIAQVIPNLVK